MILAILPIVIGFVTIRLGEPGVLDLSGAAGRVHREVGHEHLGQQPHVGLLSKASDEVKDQYRQAGCPIFFLRHRKQEDHADRRKSKKLLATLFAQGRIKANLNVSVSINGGCCRVVSVSTDMGGSDSSSAQSPRKPDK